MIRKLIILSIVIAAIGLICFHKWLTQNGPLSQSTNIEIKKGSSLSSVATLLAEKNVIRFPLVFKLKGRLMGWGDKIKAGEYQFEPNISSSEVLDKIVNGDILYHQVTIPEGKTVGEIMYIIETHPKLSGEISIEVKEGELLPETYSFSAGQNKNDLIKEMQKKMQKTLDKAWKNREKNPYIKTKQDALILASIIEKETAVASERALVASVFLNRLKKGMRLQTDPTVIYAITNGEFNFGRKLYRKDLQYDNPYNTYKYYGLPPGPICNPGEESIVAALNPEHSDYYYFVADGNGGHSFGKTLKEHNQNVANWKKKKAGKK